MRPSPNPTETSSPMPILGSRARWVAGGLAVGLLAAAIASPAFLPRPILAVDPVAPEHTISVTGTGRVIISPDLADVRLGVSVTAKTVKSARATNAAAMTAVVDSLKKLGIDDRDIQTTTLSLSPVYDYSTDAQPPKLTGYALANAVAVTIRDLDIVGDAIDASLAAGATTMDGVSFRVDDPAAAEKQARENAMAEAKAKAQTLAASAGVAITGIASISETVAPIPYPVYYGRANAVAEDTATPIQPGTNEVSVTVAVSYLIR
jgi:uncharacterized protein YggE